jgi:hypothetical protein
MDQPRLAFLEDTRQFWQARTSRVLTLEDARQAVENVTGFFATLQRWAAAESSSAGKETTTDGVHDFEPPETGGPDYPQRSGEREGGRQDRQENRAHNLARHSQRQTAGLGHTPVLSNLGFGSTGASEKEEMMEGTLITKNDIAQPAAPRAGNAEGTPMSRES